jgi:hypothetical protein
MEQGCLSNVKTGNFVRTDVESEMMELIGMDICLPPFTGDTGGMKLEYEQT